MAAKSASEAGPKVSRLPRPDDSQPGFPALHGRLWIAIAALFAVIAAASWVHWHVSRYDDAIGLSASRYGVDFFLVKALIFEESWFRSGIRGSSGEIGLMQVTRAAAADYASQKGFLPFNEEHLFDPRLNIDIGCWYLSRSIERYKSAPAPVLFALLRYNAGEVRADAWVESALGKPSPAGVDPERYYLSLVNFPKTREYARRILQRSRSRNFWF
jgi:soluble lytic murein transglycosylase